MSRAVLDSSAIMALILNEPGSEKVTKAQLSDAVASTVNLAEVQAKLVSHGWPPDEAWEDALSFVRKAVAFEEEQAKLAGSLVAQTRPLGLSLGDRACLALGLLLRVPVYTADRSWARLHLRVPVHVIR